WLIGHARLFEELTTGVPREPVSRDELEILHSAVRHGCAAARRREALDVLVRRILQLDETGERYFSLHRFGMFAEGLSALSGFYQERWSLVHADLDPPQRAQILVVTGYCLRAVGDLEQAELATRLARDSYQGLGNASEAADAAGNLTQILIASGRL